MLFVPKTTALIALIFLSISGKAKAQITEIEFRGTEIQNVVSPYRKVERNPVYLKVTIENSHGKTVFHERLGTFVDRPDVSIEAGKAADRGLHTATWSIIGPDRIKGVARTASYDLISVGTITGETCKVTNTYKLHPGQSYYILTNINTGSQVFASHLQMEVTSCLVRRNNNRINPSG
jgi:hypothetical protein